MKFNPLHPHCGPFNDIDEKQPSNNIDRLCWIHDRAYGKLKDPYFTFSEADEAFLRGVKGDYFAGRYYAMFFELKKLLAKKRIGPFRMEDLPSNVKKQKLDGKNHFTNNAFKVTTPMARRMRMRKRKRGKSSRRRTRRRKGRSNKRYGRKRFRGGGGFRKQLAILKESLIEPCKWRFRDAIKVSNSNFGQSTHTWVPCFDTPVLLDIRDCYHRYLNGAAPTGADHIRLNYTRNRYAKLTVCNAANYNQTIKVYAVYAGQSSTSNDPIVLGNAIMSEDTAAYPLNTAEEYDFDYTMVKRLKYFFKFYTIGKVNLGPNDTRQIVKYSKKVLKNYEPNAVDKCLRRYLCGFYIVTRGQPLHDTTDDSLVSGSQAALNVLIELSCEVFKPITEKRALLKSALAAHGFDTVVEGQLMTNEEQKNVNE